MSRRRLVQPKGQSGAALIVSLLMLMVMTLIGVGAMESTVLEEKMAGNYRDRDRAFQAAEAALRAAEIYIMAQNIADFYNPDIFKTSGALSATSGLLGLSYDDSGVDYLAETTWTTAGSYQTYDFDGDGDDADDPRYIIRFVSESPPKKTFMVTAYAKGGGQGTRVILRAFYERTY